MLLIFPFVSAVAFPWPYTALLACWAAVYEPFTPLAVGVFFDLLYYVSGTGTLPIATFGGLIVSLIAWFVRGRLRAGIIA